MPKQTIAQVAVYALQKSGKPMEAEEIFNFITEHKLYTFHTDEPLGVLKSELDKHSEGVDREHQVQMKYFTLKNGKYWLKDVPVS